MELKKLKIKKVTELGCTEVRDLTVEDVQHYITDNGVIHHNTGPEYAASIILFLSKAQLKDGDSKTGIIMTVKPNKNRFSIPNTIKIHVHFHKGMNAYVGLEQFLGWEECGITTGQIIDSDEVERIEKRVEREKDEKKRNKLQDTLDKIKATEFKYKNENRYLVVHETGEPFRIAGTKKGLAVKHLGRQVSPSELFTGRVFTEEVRNMIDERFIKPQFEYKLQEHEDLMEELNNIDEQEESED